MRLVEATGMSDAAVAEHNRRNELRQRFDEQSILIAALCRELKGESEAGNFPSDRSEAAYGLLNSWEGEVFGAATESLGATVKGRYAPGQVIGTVDERFEIAPDLVEEVRLGAAVQSALSFVYSADCGNEYERDVQNLRESLGRYIAVVDTV